ncbi:MAG: hypothetical protein ACI8P3_000430 [Saprospiraceae bacterium]|jgi:hypothetical protein
MRSILQKFQATFYLILALCITQNALSQCGYDVSLTATDLTIEGTIFNTQTYGPDIPQEISWFLPAGGFVFSNDPTFEFFATSYGDCTICVDYIVSQQDGSSCTEVICRNFRLVDPALVCGASFGFQTYSGPSAVPGGITFSNYSTGPYDEWSWDFGDGNVDAQSQENVSHFYQVSGSYEVKLSVWNGTPQDCYAEYTQVVDVFISDDPCDQMDCVWPGDTNKDGTATLEDMINIGVGFGMSGEPRDSTSNNWAAQSATDWGNENAAGVNYKHFDCDGNGAIEVNDILAIQSNFMMMENGMSMTSSEGVPISLSFDVDTVVITEENQELEINAGLNFGSSDVPMNDVYAVVLYLTYPKHYVVESAPVDFDYNENSFFGDFTTTLPMARNIQEEGQMDIVLTRKNSANISGQGRVASVKFIIDSDIIDGRVENEGETFSIGINIVKAIDYEGNIIDISLPAEATGVFFQNGIPTKTIDLIDESRVRIFPNPVNETLQIILEEQLHPKEIEIFNLMGQRVIFSEMNNSKLDINVSKFPQGIYILKVKTEEGIASKRIVVE